MTLKDRCCVVGVGNTAYTRGTDKTTMQLHLEAALKALADAGLMPSDVDAVFPNPVAGTIAEDFIINLGIRDLHMTATMHNGGASIGSSLQSACMAVATGIASCALIVAGRRGYSAQRASKGITGSPLPVMNMVHEFEGPFGNTGVAHWFAHAARRHMHLYGTKSEHLGRIAVVCRKHANLNPQAYMYGRPMTLEDHQNSPWIIEPFHLLDASLETDGAGALVVTSAERAQDLRKTPVYVMGIAEGHAPCPTSITQKEDMTDFEGVRLAAPRAFGMAGVSLKDVDFAELMDGWTWVALACLEAVGFCGQGEAGPFVESVSLEIGGKLPINTSGGLLSEAHVSGINHYIEAVRQLRREVEPARQVKNCEIGLVVPAGDFHDGVVSILRR